MKFYHGTEKFFEGKLIIEYKYQSEDGDPPDVPVIFRFPVGLSGVYLPITLDAISSVEWTASGWETQTVGAEIIAGPPPAYTLPLGAHKVSEIRHMKISFGGTSPFINGYHLGFSINPVDGIADLQQALLLETSGSSWHFIENELTGNWLYGLWLGAGGEYPAWETKTYVLAEKEYSLKCPADTTVYVPTGQTSAVVNGIAPVVLSSSPGLTVEYYTEGATDLYGVGDASGERFWVGNTTLHYFAFFTSYELNCKSQISVVPISTFLWYRDRDGDGFGRDNVTRESETQPKGFVLIGGDCNDNDPTIYPGASELPDGKDNNCDGQVDEGLDCRIIWYRDRDGDGYGRSSHINMSCVQPPGYANNADDCNDNDAAIYPGAPELPDGKDNNCNGEIDEGLPCRVVWYRDKDGDGFGRKNVTILSCVQPRNYVDKAGDCNDNDSTIYPGAPELCDGKDNNCNGTKDEECIILTSTEEERQIQPLSTISTGRLTINLWPNPAKTEFIVTLTGIYNNENVELVLLSLAGRPVQFKRIHPITGQQVRFQVGALHPGIYFLRVTQGQLLFTHKIAVIR